MYMVMEYGIYNDNEYPPQLKVFSILGKCGKEFCKGIFPNTNVLAFKELMIKD